MKTGTISKHGVERIGFPTLVARETSTLFKQKDLEILTSVVNVGSEFSFIHSKNNLKKNSFFNRSENPELWYDKGCIHSFQNWIVKHLHVVGTIGLVIASIQLIGLLCSMLLFCSVKRRSKRSPESYKSYSPSSADLHSKNVTSWED